MDEAYAALEKGEVDAVVFDAPVLQYRAARDSSVQTVGFRQGHTFAAVSDRGAGVARDVIHRELHGYLWVALGLGALSLAAIVVSELQDHPLGGALVLVGIAAFLLAVMAEGIHRMNCITLRRDRLTVGRDTFRQGDIDALFGVQPSLVLRPDEQERVEDDWPIPHGSAIRVAGGGWGRRWGTHLVLLRETATQDLVAVFSRDPQALDRHLGAWLQQLPDTPSG